MKRKPLEGIEAVLFTLGAGVGYLLHVYEYSWWVALLIVFVLGLVLSKAVDYLREMNKKLVQ